MSNTEHGLKGRPSNARKPQNEGKRTNLNIRVSSEDMKKWTDEAGKKGLTRSKWITRTLNMNS